jgi:CheY-like chemotaxis protein
MKKPRRKSIFYFEDNVYQVMPIINSLEENYKVTVGAHWEVIKEERLSPFDLVFIDLMIHNYSFDREGKEVKNVSFKGINWNRTGIEFLRRIRQGEYEKFGFFKDVPVIIVTAVGDYNVKNELHVLGIDQYIEKPFIIEDIEKAVSDIFSR